jgi:hypothetical protein
MNESFEDTTGLKTEKHNFLRLLKRGRTTKLNEPLVERYDYLKQQTERYFMGQGLRILDRSHEQST